MALARGYLWFVVIMSLVFGGIYLFDPRIIAGPMGIEATSAVGLTDLRATYGGFQLAMAAFAVWCLRDESRYDPGLVAFACLVGGLAGCRTVGLLMDGFTAEMAGATTLEIVLTLVTLFVRSRFEASRAAAG